MSNESINKVYVLTQSSGEYEDYHVSIIGVFKSREDAIAHGKSVDEHTVPEKIQYPMSMDRFEEMEEFMLDRPDDDYEYSSSDFQRMSELMAIRSFDYHECEVEEFELL